METESIPNTDLVPGVVRAGPLLPSQWQSRGTLRSFARPTSASGLAAVVRRRELDKRGEEPDSSPQSSSAQGESSPPSSHSTSEGTHVDSSEEDKAIDPTYTQTIRLGRNRSAPSDSSIAKLARSDRTDSLPALLKQPSPTKAKQNLLQLVREHKKKPRSKTPKSSAGVPMDKAVDETNRKDKADTVCRRAEAIKELIEAIEKRSRGKSSAVLDVVKTKLEAQHSIELLNLSEERDPKRCFVHCEDAIRKIRQVLKGIGRGYREKLIERERTQRRIDMLDRSIERGKGTSSSQRTRDKLVAKEKQLDKHWCDAHATAFLWDQLEIELNLKLLALESPGKRREVDLIRANSV